MPFAPSADCSVWRNTISAALRSGTPDGGTESKLGPGSYLLQRGGQFHVSGCAAGADCEFFMSSSDKFDLIVADAPAAEKPAAEKK